MYHITTIGLTPSDAPGIVDQHGFVPQEGDAWRDMHYDLSESDSDLSDADEIEYLDEEWWPEMIAAALAFTVAQEASVAAFQAQR